MKRNNQFRSLSPKLYLLFIMVSFWSCHASKQLVNGISQKGIDLVGIADGLPVLPPPAPFPDVPAPKPPGSVTMGDTTGAKEVRTNFPIAQGSFEPTWASITKNYPGYPDWLREAKFGIWVHFGPQAAGMSGDWFARKMYLPGTPAYNNQLKKYGHPADSGYKEVLRDWNPIKLDPASLVKLYHDIGARFMLIQGVHHDNFDLWNSKYQPWNSVNIGPHKDLMGEWAKAVKKAGMHYGVAFHHEYTWWWWQSAFNSDKTGAKAGIPYDGALTLADGKGKWWEGYDPRLLYGVNMREYKGMDEFRYNLPSGIFSNHLDYAKWYVDRWALRIADVVSKYDPDFIYTDGNASQPFSGWNSGTGYKSDADQRMIASYFNHALARHGKVDVFSITKFSPPRNGIVTTFEGNYPKGIKTDQPWIGENAVGDWYYAPDYTYQASSVIRMLLEYVSRDGSYAVSIPIKPDGSLEPACIDMLHQIGAWLNINGQAIYGSKAWKVLGEGKDDKLRTLPGGALGKKQADFAFGPEDIRFTQGKDGHLYAFTMMVPPSGTTLIIHSLAKNNSYGQTVSNISLLGSKNKLIWVQGSDGLHITLPDTTPFRSSLCFKID